MLTCTVFPLEHPRAGVCPDGPDPLCRDWEATWRAAAVDSRKVVVRLEFIVSRVLLGCMSRGNMNL